uniref:Uncharacterized protein n=1 Tax=viral metagenome TaxID=1070528 RepID=A0A6C0KYC2_9ZZZZ
MENQVDNKTEKKTLSPFVQEQIDFTEKRAKFLELKMGVLKRNPKCSVIIVDNFYNNPMDTRNYILTQNFEVKGNYPGKRTRSYANNELKETIQKYVGPFSGKITEFPLDKDAYNGAFQYTTSRDRSWIHIDGFNNWAGVCFLTPDAPISSGTGFYRFCDGTTSMEDQQITKSKEETDKYSQDMTKWELIDSVGNIFNRLVLFNSKNFHMSMDYFGDDKYNGRLFQVFFFSTEM